MTSGPEFAAPQIDNLALLQEARMQMAEKVSASQMASAFIDRTSNPRDSITFAEDHGDAYFLSILSPADLMACEAVGISSDSLLAKTSMEDTEPTDTSMVAEAKIADETLRLYTYGEGVTLRLTSAANPNGSRETSKPSPVMTKAVQDRFRQSPPYREMARVREVLKDKGWQSEAMPAMAETDWFNPGEDPLGTLCFLGDIDLCNTFYSSRQLRSGQSALEIIDTALAKVPEYHATIQKDENGTTYTWGSGARRQLFVDAKTGNYRYRVTQAPEDNYQEIANQALLAKEKPFIESQCAREICSWLDQNGLMFAPKYQYEMIRTGEAERYGSVYTQLSREVAKWVDSRSIEPPVENLFVPFDEALTAPAMAADYLKSQGLGLDVEPREADHETVKTAVANTDLTRFQGEAATVLMTMIASTMSRADFASALPVTQKRISITKGACFDVAAYYIGAAGDVPDWQRAKALAHTAPNGVSMLHKQHGSETFMLTQPIVFNGVPVPKGSLFSQHEDGWAFQRLTPFCFDNPEDQLATGSELAKAYVNETRALQEIGGHLLQNLTDSRPLLDKERSRRGFFGVR